MLTKYFKVLQNIINIVSFAKLCKVLYFVKLVKCCKAVAMFQIVAKVCRTFVEFCKDV